MSAGFHTGFLASAVTDTFICHVFSHPSMVESVKLVVLIAFCSQGDNVLDATSLVLYLDEWLKLKLQSGKVCFFFYLYVTNVLDATSLVSYLDEWLKLKPHRSRGKVIVFHWSEGRGSE